MKRFSITSADGKTALAAYRFDPEHPRAMFQISHGMCEYFLRYRDFAEFLTSRGFLVFGHDHLGHGATAQSPEQFGFTASGGGAEFLVEDVHNLSLHMKQEHPELPLILFGHSMGSFISRAVLSRYGTLYHASVICGTGGPETPAGAGRALASLFMTFRGEHYRSQFLKHISFSGYTKRFEKGCDPNAWLTRDREVVRRYNADPLSNYTFTLRAYHDLFSLISEVSSKDWALHIPKSLPILVTSGDADPVGNFGKGPTAVAKRLDRAGIADVTLKLYPQMRHEILNETDHETVWEDIAAWTEKTL